MPSFPSNSSISALVLDFNRLSDLKSVPPELQTLSANGNRLISLSGLQYCTSLLELRLSRNFISDDQLGSLLVLRGLKVLKISENRLCDGFGLSQVLRLPRLEGLDVAGNAVTALEVQYPATALKRLVLDCNRLEKLDLHAECPSLIHLSCSDNRLSSLEGLKNAPRLQYLHLDMNNFSDFPNNLSSLKPLRLLSMAHNSLTHPSPLHLPVLQHFHCSYNCIHSLSFLSSCRQLQQVHSDHNHLEDLAFGSLPDLRVLRVA